MPSRVGVAISDTASGMFLTQGVLAALFARERTGKGQWVYTSLLETMINMLDFQAARWLIDGEIPRPAGNHHPSVSPFGTFETADGHINIGALDFPLFCNQVGLSRLLSDPRFRDGPARLAHRDELTKEIEAVLKTKTSDEWIRSMGALIPCGPINRIDQVFADEQVQHLKVTQAVEHPTLGSVRVLRYPVTFSDMNCDVTCGVTVPGAQSRQVLEELGYGEDQIDRFIAEKIVATSNVADGW